MGNKLYTNYVLPLIIGVLMSCNDTSTPVDSIEKDLMISMPEKFELIKTESEVAIGDYYLSYLLQFDSVQFEEIIEQVIHSPFFYDSLPSRFEIESEKLKIWYKTPYGYRFEHEFDGIEERVECEINIERKMLEYWYIYE